MNRLLVLGSNGQVATELRAALVGLGEVTCAGRTECDMARPESVGPFLRGFKPDVIINAAAYTAVDKAESEPDLSRSVNATSVGEIATAARALRVPVIHYSTDYVFDGTKGALYVETDPTNPLNVYGQTKLEGERALAETGAAHATFRISWIYGAHGSNFLRTMLHLGREREELKIVDDQWGSPTSSAYVARQTAAVVRNALASGDPVGYFTERSGPCHLSPSGLTTWRKFAERIFETDPNRDALRVKRVIPIPASEYRTAARRPAYSGMDNGLARSRFGLAQQTWETLLAEVMASIARGATR